jgi:hypothetical protein
MVVGFNCIYLFGLLDYYVLHKLYSDEQYIEVRSVVPLASFIVSSILLHIKPELYDRSILRVMAIFYSMAIGYVVWASILVFIELDTQSIPHLAGAVSWVIFQRRPELLRFGAIGVIRSIFHYVKEWIKNPSTEWRRDISEYLVLKKYFKPEKESSETSAPPKDLDK